jgi:hypothetical protein
MSAVIEDSRGASDTTTSRPVLRTEASTGSRSSGDSVRRSMTSNERPSAWAASAADSRIGMLAP